MVFEGVVATLLNKYLGKYIKHLDSKNLSVGIWSGHVILQDLELRGNALADFGLPIEVHSGYVGKLCLEIPWSSLYSQPVVIRLEDVYVLAAPLAENVYDKEKETQYEQDLKQTQLARFEAAAKTTTAETEKPSNENDSFTEKLIGQIVKNLQIFVTNIHVRYEDKLTNSKSPFTIGLTLESFKAETTDKAWKPIIIKEDVKKIYKTAKLDGLSLYWNTSVDGTQLFKGHNKWKTFLKQTIGSSANQTYVLKPFTTIAHIYLDQSSGYAVNVPKVIVDVIQSHLELSLTKKQFKNLMDVIESFEMMSINQQYRPFRPKVDVKTAPRKWWKYAFNTYIHFHYLPWTWRQIKQHRTLYREYVDLYFQKLINTNFSLKDADQTAPKIESLEKKLNVATILIARQQAKHRFLIEEDVLKAQYETEKKKEAGGWLGWLGWSNAEETDKADQESDIQPLPFDVATQSLSAEEQEKLYRAIGYAEEQANPNYSKEYVKGKIIFNLKRLSLKLHSENDVEIMHFLLQDVNADGRYRPGSSGQSMELKVSDILLKGRIDGSNNVNIVNSARSQSTSDLLSFLFETNPTNVKADFRCSVKLEPIIAFFNWPFLQDLQEFFTLENDAKLKELEIAASKRFNDISNASRAGLEHAIMHNRTTYLHIDVKSPRLIYPCLEIGEKAVICAKFGDLSVMTDLQTELHSQSIREATESDLEAMFYHQLNIKLISVSISLHKEGLSSTLCDYILKPCDMGLLMYRSLKAGYANFPDFKVEGQLGSLVLAFNPCKTDCVILFVSYIIQAIESPSNAQQQKDNSDSHSTASRRSSMILSKDDMRSLSLLTSDKNVESRLKSRVLSESYRSATSQIDSIQDDDEDEWFNAEENLTDNESTKADISYDATLSSLDRTKLQCHLKIKEIALFLEEFKSDKEDVNSSLVLSQFQVEITQKLWTLEVKGSLSGIELLDWNTGMKKHQSLKEDSGQQLLKVVYQYCDFSGPVSSKLLESEQDLNISLGKLGIDLSDDSIICMMLIGDYFSTGFKKEQKADLPVPVSATYRQLAPIQEDEEFEETVDAQPPVNGKQTIVSVSPISVADIEVILHHSRSSSNDLGIQNSDVDVVVRLPKVKVILMYDIIVALQAFVENITSEETRDTSKDMAIATMSNQAQLIEEKHIKISLDVEIDAPDIIIPIERQNQSFLYIDLGKLFVRNEFVYKKSPDDSEDNDDILIDKLHLTIQSAAISCQIGKHSDSILKPLSLFATIERPLLTENCGIPKLDISTHIASIMIDVSDSSLQTIAGILSENLSAGPSNNKANSTIEVSNRQGSSEEDKREDSKNSEDASLKNNVSNWISINCGIDLVAVKLSSNIKIENNALVGDLLEVEAKTFSFNLTLKDGATLIDMKQSHLEIIDLSAKNHSLQASQILSIDGNVKPLSFYYGNECDDESQSNSINLHIPYCLITIRKDTILLILKYINQISNWFSHGRNHTESQIISHVPSSTKTNDSEVTSEYAITMPSICFIIEDGTQFALEAKLEGTELQLLSTANVTTIKFRLSDAKISDQINPFYGSVLSFSGKPAASIEIEIKEKSCYPLHWNSENDPEKLVPCISDIQEDVRLTATISQFMFTFLYKIIGDVLNVIDEVTKALPSKAEIKTEKLTIEPITTSPSKMLLDVRIAGSSIVIPKSSISTSGLIIKFNSIEVSNELSLVEEYVDLSLEFGDIVSVFVRDILALSLNGIQLSSFQMMNDKKITNQLLVGLIISSKIQRDLICLADTLLIDVSINDANLKITESELNLLSFAIAENFAEATPQTKDDGKLPASPQTPDENKANPLKIKVKIDSPLIHVAMVTVNGNTSLAPFSHEDASILGVVTLKGCSIVIELNVSNPVDVSCGFSSIQIDDDGTSSRMCYNHLLTRKASLSKETFLLTASVTENGTNVFVSLIDSEIICVLTALQSLLTFVQVAYTPPTQIEVIANTMETEADVHIEETAPRKPPSAFMLHMIVNNCDIVMLETPDEDHSSAVVARVFLDGHLSQIDSKMELRIGMDSVEMLFGSYPGLDRLTKTLLQKCSMKFKYVTPFKDGLGQDISIMINKMEFSVSPVILREIVNITNSTLGNENKEVNSSNTQTANQDVIGIDWKPFPLSKQQAIEESETTTDNSDIIIPSTDHTGVDNFHLNIQMIQLSIGNDMKGMVVPLLSIKCGIRTNVSDWTSNLKCDCNFTIEMTYFNDKLACWEPLLEPDQSNKRVTPYEIRVNVMSAKSQKMTLTSHDAKMDIDAIIPDSDVTDAPEKAPMATYVIVNSEDFLQLTITSETIDVCTRLYTSWMSEDQDPCKEFNLQSPYHFSNKLDKKITVWTKVGLMASSDDCEDTIILERKAVNKPSSGRSSRFTSARNRIADESDNRPAMGRQSSLPTINQYRGIKALVTSPSFEPPLSPFSSSIDGSDSTDNDVTSNVWAFDCQSHTECVSAMVDGYHPIRHVTFKTTGMVLYSLIPWKTGLPEYLISDVSSSCGKKEITFRTTLQIKNHLAEDVVLYFDEDNSNSIDLPANTLVSIPLNMINAEKMTVQLIGCLLCNESVDLNYKTGSSQNIKCQRIDQSDAVCNVKVLKVATRVKDVGLKQAHHNRIIHLLPPIVICNLLPFSAIIELQSFAPIEMASGEKKEIVDVPSDLTELDCSIKVDQGYWYGFKGSLLLQASDTNPQMFTMSANDRDQQKFIVEVTKHMERSVEVTFRSRYWIINKTALDLDVKVSKVGNIYHCQRGHEDPVLIHYVTKSSNKLYVRMTNSTWSDGFSIDAVGTEMQIQCKREDGYIFEVIVSVTVSNTGLMNLIELRSQFVVANKMKIDLMFLEDGKEDWILIKRDQVSAFWPQTSKKLMYVKQADTVYTSQLFPFDHGHHSLLRLSSDITVVVAVTHIGQSIYITFKSLCDANVPVLVENFCESVVLEIQQKGLSTQTQVESYSGLKYNWDDLTKKKILQWSIPQWQTGIHSIALTSDSVGYYKIDQDELENGSQRKKKKKRRGKCLTACITSCTTSDEVTTRSETGSLLHGSNPVLLSRSDIPDMMFWICQMRGSQRVLTFTEDLELFRALRKSSCKEYISMDLYISMKGVGISVVNAMPKEIAYISLTGATPLWETKGEGKEEWTPVEVDTCTFLEDAFKNGVNTASYEKTTANLKEMKLLQPYAADLRRKYEPAVWLQYSMSQYHMSIHARLYRLQVDSQQYNVEFPCVLYPTPLPPSIVKQNGIKPFLEVSMVSGSAENLTIIKYFKLLIQGMNLKIDRDFLEGMLSMYMPDIDDVDEPALFREDMEMISESIEEKTVAAIDSKSNPLLIEYLQLSPLKVNLSFSLHHSSKSSSKSKTQKEDAVGWLVNSLGVTFTEVTDVEIKLAYFERTDVLLSNDQLVAEATRHYKLQALKQFHVLVLGLDVLGNPYGLITDIGKGFKDLFYEPYQGVVEGPEHFAKGLATGVRSLLGHTIGGTANAFSKITDQLGSAVAVLSFDAEYQRKRRENMRHGPTNFTSGVAQGGKHFAMGVVFGLSGIVTKPIQGARHGGVEGFFKGVGTGIIGLLAKPTGGVIDLVTSTLDGVRRLAEEGGEDIFCRIRIPRVTYPNEILECYDQLKAEGFGLLKTVDVNAPDNDFYRDHIFTASNNDSEAIILTTRRILRVSQNRIFDNWSMSWSYNYNEIEDVKRSVTGILLSIKDESSKEKEVFVNCSTKTIIADLYQSIEELYSQYHTDAIS